jgi:hypothetical protein
MGENSAPLPGLHSQAAEEDAAPVALASVTELLLVYIERGRLLTDEDALLKPLAQRLRRRLIGIAALGELQAYGVMGAETVEAALLLRGDRIEGGADHSLKVDGGGVPQSG